MIFVNISSKNNPAASISFNENGCSIFAGNNNSRISLDKEELESLMDLFSSYLLLGERGVEECLSYKE